MKTLRFNAVLALVVAIVAIPVLAYSQVVINPLGGSGGGSGSTEIDIGTTPIVNGTDTRVLFDDAGVVGEDAGFTYAKATGIAALTGGATVGSTTTQGTATSLLRGTTSGASATSNFFNITGTNNTTLTAPYSSLYISTTTAGSSAQPINGVFSVLSAGYTGTNHPSAGRFENDVASTGSLSGLLGGTGGSVGVDGRVSAGTAAGGVVGRATGGTTAIGVVGVVTGGTTKVGGLFTLGNASSPASSVGLFVDNGSFAVPIAIFADNTTPVVTIADGGETTFTARVNSLGLKLTSGAEPTCDSSIGGQFWYVAGGAGVADTVKVCAKDGADAYAWRTIY